MKDLTIPAKQRNYIPQDIQIKWEALSPIFEELLSRNIQNVNELEKWLQDKSELEALLEENFAWRYIKMTCDTTNEQLVQDFQYFATEIEPKISPIANQLNIKLIESPFLEELDQEKYFIYLRGIKKSLELFREENIELFTKLQVTQQKYQSISGSMSIHYKDKEYTLEQASNFLKSTNREEREEVWKLVQKRRLVDRDELNILFDELINLRHQVALNAGFENYRDYAFQALGRFDYNAQDCYEFANAIEKEIVPILEKRAALRKDSLGLDSLRPWDTEVNLEGKAALKPFENGDDLINKTIDCFKGIDPSLGEKIEIMKHNKLFDVDSRMGKAPGGYNYPLAETGAPFIFMNSANSFRDLTTMVHEGGHAIHTFLTSNLELNDFKHCPSEVAELASMSMELISMDNWDSYFSSEEDLQRAKKEQLADVLKTLPWVAVIDQFQHWIYTNHGHTVADRDEAFKQIYNRFGGGFTNWEDFELEFSNVWQKQLHLFEVPFYYIEYAIAQLGAIAVWKNFKENPEKGLKQYLDALSLGYTKTIGDIYNTAGIQFDFKASYVKELASFVSNELDKLEA